MKQVKVGLHHQATYLQSLKKDEVSGAFPDLGGISRNNPLPTVVDKTQYPYGPPVRIIRGIFEEEKTPKEIYEYINPNNEYCTFSIVSKDKVYEFFNNIVNGKKYRHYTIIEAVSTDF